MRVALVHDWFVNYAGAERVVEQMLECFPEADLFSLVDFLPKDKRGFIKNKPVTTSLIQKMPFAKGKYRNYLPLMPFAIEQLDLTGYDIILSSSHCVAKGVIVGPDQLHISYIYSPVRYAWDFQFQYLRESGLDKGLKGFFAKRVLHKVRMWDVTTANRVDYFLTLSKFISRRIDKAYRRESTIIHPPVYTADFELCTQKDNFYLAASRLVPYKRLDLIVDAFVQMPDKKLVVIGDGPEMPKIKKKANGAPNIQVMGFQPFEVLKDHMARAKAFIYAAEDDFSIVTIEAQACGTPAIAYGKGAVTEIVRDLNTDNPTGMFFKEQTPDSLVETVLEFDQHIAKFSPEACRENALRFSCDKFRERFSKFVKEKWALFSKCVQDKG